MHSMLSAKNAPPTLFLLLPCLHYFAHLVANNIGTWSIRLSLAFLCVDPLRCCEQYQHMCKIRKPKRRLQCRLPLHRTLAASSGAA